MVNKKVLSLLMAVVTAISLVGCGASTLGDQGAEVSLSLADELAAGVSEDVIPLEAKRYSSVYFEIPEGMKADEDNTDNECYYISEMIDDLSYITYIRQDNFDVDWYNDLTQEKYSQSFSSNVDTNVVIDSFEKSERDGYCRIEIAMKYKKAGVSFDVKEYIYVTDDFLFTVAYAMDVRHDWSSEFAASQGSLALKSVVNQVADNPDYVSVSADEVEETSVSQGSVLDTLTVGIDIE